MAAISGIDGSVSCNTFTGIISAWNGDLQENVNDVSGFGEDWDVNINGAKRMRGTVAGFVDDAANTFLPNGSTATLSLLLKTGKGYSLSARIFSFKTGTDRNGVATFMFDFVSTGDVSAVGGS